MPVGDPDALQLARDFAPEAEEILGVKGLVDELNVLSEDAAAAQEAQDRILDLGDIASIAQTIITLFMSNPQGEGFERSLKKRHHS